MHVVEQALECSLPTQAPGCKFYDAASHICFLEHLHQRLIDRVREVYVHEMEKIQEEMERLGKKLVQQVRSEIQRQQQHWAQEASIQRELADGVVKAQAEQMAEMQRELADGYATYKGIEGLAQQLTTMQDEFRVLHKTSGKVGILHSSTPQAL